MSVWWQLAIGIAVLWLALRFVLSRIGLPEPHESTDRSYPPRNCANLNLMPSI
jgi:hypothetical protein